MKVTLDHRCILHLAERTPTGLRLERALACPSLQCFVVNIGDSALRERGVWPERYDRFENVLAAAGVAHLPRLDPLFIVDVTFWGRCVSAAASDEGLARDIGRALFGEAPAIEVPSSGLDSPAGRRWLDRHCDVQALWCHIRQGNQVFLTPEEGFRHDARRPRLSALGAGRICLPGEI